MDLEETRDYLEVCTDNENDWKAFLSLCASAFQDSAPFKRSHPNPVKRKKFTKVYFKYLYETELSDGRAGLVCLKRPRKDLPLEIIYGIVGVYPGQVKYEGDESEMMKIGKMGMEIHLREDEWSRRHITEKLSAFSKIHNCSYINYAIQAARYPNRGIATKYMMSAAEMLGFDGIKSGKIPHLPVIAYAVLDDVKIIRLYETLGMIELAHLHSNAGNYLCVDTTAKEDHDLCDCLFLMYRGYPERRVMEHELKKLFRTSLKSAGDT